MVVINNPTEGGYYGATIAGPVFKEIADKVYATQANMYQLVDETREKPVSPPASTGYKEEIYTVYSMLDYPLPQGEPQSDWISATSNNLALTVTQKTYAGGTVPNVIGMGARDAVYLMEKNGIKTKISGCGKVKEQSIKPGSSIGKGKEVMLILASN
jgi:cell division protein FtsI (penicillin-binding protein 3)